MYLKGKRRSSIASFISDESGAVAATYALALIGLVAAAGVGFDFARLATMSSELHNAADQAALAAATQLDGSSSAITNATSAASNLVSNQTLLANDGQNANVVVSSLTFFKTYADAEAWTNPTTDPTAARFVKVAVKSRKAYYAFTPIVAAISSGDIAAAATAGLGSAICKVPPVMLCNPAADPSKFDASSYAGDGLLLKATGGGGAWAPGDFGFLDVGAGANDLKKLIGYSSLPDSCVDVANPSTEPGAIASVINYFNTRFDIYDSSASNDCWSGNLCPPSDNSRKDLVLPGALDSSSVLAQNQCGYNTSQGAGGKGWRISPDPYRPQSDNACSASYPCGQTGTVYPDAMGYPRDMMHAWHEPIAAGDSRFGNGIWDINAYWNVHYGVNYSGQVDGLSAPTRYDVYKWERTNAGASKQFSDGANTYTDFKAPICRSGWAPGGTQADRRVIPVAVVNCTGLSGKQKVNPVGWIDVFLVEPSISRKATFGSGASKYTTTYTNSGDIYVEIIGKSEQGAEGAEPQVVRRDKPYLVN